MNEILKSILSQIDLTGIIITILGAIGSYVAIKVKQWWEYLKSREIDKLNNELLKSLAKQAVDYVELKFREYSSRDKLEQAVDIVSKELENKGIKVSNIAKFIAIESAVKALKDSGNEIKRTIPVISPIDTTTYENSIVG